MPVEYANNPLVSLMGCTECGDPAVGAFIVEDYGWFMCSDHIDTVISKAYAEACRIYGKTRVHASLADE